jgi:hypothetical protein
MNQPWNPNQPHAAAPAPGYGQPGAPAGYGPPAAQHGAPAAAPPPGYGPPGYGPPPAYAPPPGYGPPQGAYQPPPGQGAPPQGYGPTGGTPFRPMAPNLESQNDPDLPDGDHIGVCTGNIAIVASGKLLTCEFALEKSSNPAVVGTKGNWKCWLVKTSLPGQAGDQAASDEVGRFVVPMSGRTKETTDKNTALLLVSEFVQTFKLDGQSLAGKRVGLSVRTVPPRQRKNGPGMTKEFKEVHVHILPAGQ